MLCEICNQTISEKRLRIIPSATLCTTCAGQNDVPRVVGMMVWDHKTAPYIEVDTITANQQAGKKHRYGPHISFTAKEGCFGVAAPMHEIMTLNELTQRLGRENRGEPEPEEILELARVANPSRCHSERERIGPNGLCLACALVQQKKRLRASSSTG